MAENGLRVIGWLFVAILVSGFCLSAAGRFLNVPLAIVHKLLALLCLIFLIRSAGALRAFHAPPALPAAIIVFSVAFLAAFATGAVETIPACASSLWLNLHRVAAGVAVIACAVAARFIAIGIRSSVH